MYIFIHTIYIYTYTHIFAMRCARWPCPRPVRRSVYSARPEYQKHLYYIRIYIYIYTHLYIYIYIYMYVVYTYSYY